MDFSQLESKRLGGATLAFFFGLLGLGFTLMLGQFVWLGFMMAILGALAPTLFFWADLKRIRLVLISGTNSSRFTELPADLWGYLGLLIISLLVIGYVFLAVLSPVVNTSPQLSDLNRKLAPRQIQDEAGLIRALSLVDPKYPIEITRDVDGEAQDFAKKLERIFIAGGWEVRSGFSGWDLPKGVSIAELETHRGAATVASILEQYGIEVGKNDELRAVSPDALALVVGRRP